MTFDLALFSHYYLPYEGLFHWSVHFVVPMFLLTAFLARRLSDLGRRPRLISLALLTLFLLGELANNVWVAQQSLRLLTD